MEDFVIKIGSNGRMSRYIEKCNKGLKTKDRIRLKGVKKAISKTISIAEILKRKNAELNLSQTTNIRYITISCSPKKTAKPKDDEKKERDEEEEDIIELGPRKEETKKVSMIEIVLTKNAQQQQQETPKRDETLIKKRDPNVDYEFL